MLKNIICENMKIYKFNESQNIENINIVSPEIGDYVIVKMPEYQRIESNNRTPYGFLNNNIGQIIDHSRSIHGFLIKYNIDFNTCGFIKYHFQLREDPDGCRNIFMEDILNGYWSKNKEDMQFILDAKKYNI